MSKDLLLRWADEEGIETDPSRTGELDKKNLNFNLKSRMSSFKKCTPKDNLFDHEKPLSYGNISRRVASIFHNNENRALKIKDLYKYINSGEIEQAKYNSIYVATQRLLKFGIIRRLPGKYYLLRDKELALHYLTKERVPFKGGHPVSDTPFQNQVDENSPPDGKNLTSLLPDGIFHKTDFSGVFITYHCFDRLVSEGRLIKPKPTARSRQWKYYGKNIDLHISDKTLSTWGVVHGPNWKHEITLLFGINVAKQVEENLTPHYAQIDRDIDLRLSLNDDMDNMKMTVDNGSQFGKGELEFEGKLEDINTAKDFFLNPIGTVNRLSKIEDSLCAMTKVMQDFSGFVRDNRYAIISLEGKVNKVIAPTTDDEDNGGVDYIG